MSSTLASLQAQTGSALPPHLMSSAAAPRLSQPSFERQRQQAYQAVTQSDWAKAEQLFSALLDDPRLSDKDVLALATLRLRGGDFEGTVQATRRVLDADPQHVKAAQLATLALNSQHRWQEALQLFERHLDGPARLDYAFVSNYGAALASLGRPQEALPVLLEAMALNLTDPAAHMKLALVLRDLKLYEEAAESFQTALTLDPTRLGAQLMVLHMRQHACRWDHFEATRSDIVDALAANRNPTALNEGGVFTLVAIEHPPELFRRATAQVAMRFPQIGTPLAARTLAPADGRRVRIGYVSNDFYNHATAALLVESLERRDRARFEVTLYSHSTDDGSPMQHRIRAACEHFVDISSCSDAEAAARIRADAIDILVDLKGHTLGNRLGIFAWRPAPVQASFLGFPGTSGADYIDYVIGDRWVTPLAHADRYSEAIAQMPGCYQPNDSRRPRPAPLSRAEVGLPEDRLVLGCFNQAFKISPEVFDAWMRILHAVPASVLWLLEDNPQATGNLLREAAERGIGAERLIFAPRLPNAVNLARLPLADLMLDNWPCNAHTTASDMLWMGVPFVTVEGEAFASRVAGSLLRAVGLDEMVCDSAAAYVDRVIDLMTHADRRQALRSRLASVHATAPVFDGASHARGLEDLFLRMVDRAAKGLAPAALPASDAPELQCRVHAPAPTDAAPARPSLARPEDGLPRLPAPVVPLPPPSRIVIDGVFFQMNNTGIARLWRSIITEWAKEDFGKRIFVLDRGGSLPPLPGIETMRIPHYRYEAMDLDPFLLEWACRQVGAGLFLSTYYSVPVETPSLFLAYDMIPEVTGMNLKEPSWVAKHQAIRHAKAHASISHSTARDLHAAFPQVPLSTIDVVHLAAAPEFRPPAAHEVEALKARLGIRKPYLLTVGYRHGYKNGRLLFEALAALPDPGAFEVVCCGGQAQLEPEFKALAPKVKVHVARLSDDELRAAYGGAAALVYASRYEGFGLPILEAMACDCPVITCRSSSLPEVGGDAVVYVSDTDPADLARVLSQLGAPMTDDLRRKGRQRAEAFSWARAAAELKQSILRACPPPPVQMVLQSAAVAPVEADPQTLLEAAHAALQSGELDRAEQLLVSLLGCRPGELSAYIALSALRERKGDLGMARQILEAGLAVDGDSVPLWQALIELGLQHERDRMITDIIQALDRLPQGGDGQWDEWLVEALMERREMSHALDRARAGLSRFPDNERLQALDAALAALPVLSVVIPTTRRADRLQAFLASLPDALRGLRHEVIGIIPASDSASREVLARHGGRWVDESAVCPEGFNWSRAMNAGFRSAEGTWAMYASDDIRLEAGALAKAIAVGDLGGVAAVALMESTPTDAGTPPWHVRMTQGGRTMVNFGIVRLSAYDAVGGFDERFDFYAGDWDFCLRLHRAGHAIVPLAEGKVFHDTTHDATKRAHIAGFDEAVRRLRAEWSPPQSLGDPVFPARFLVPDQLAAFESSLLAPLYKAEAVRRGKAWAVGRARWKDLLGDYAALDALTPQPPKRTTVFCAIWHRDPRRWELARAHQACLDAQTVPVQRVYVLDGGDQAPDWLKGTIVSSAEPLGLYEAWARAVEVVDTPYVMNLNLDDRLNPETVSLFEQMLDSGIDLVGGDWRIAFDQDETDRVDGIQASDEIPFHPQWPPVPGRPVRLGSGTGERGTFGPATAWRTDLHRELGPYPSVFADGSPVRVIGDSLWWRQVQQRGKRLVRLPVIVGRYHSHPGEQAEFRNPTDVEEATYRRVGLRKA